MTASGSCWWQEMEMLLRGGGRIDQWRGAGDVSMMCCFAQLFFFSPHTKLDNPSPQQFGNPPQDRTIWGFLILPRQVPAPAFATFTSSSSSSPSELCGALPSVSFVFGACSKISYHQTPLSPFGSLVTIRSNEPYAEGHSQASAQIRIYFLRSEYIFCASREPLNLARQTYKI